MRRRVRGVLIFGAGVAVGRASARHDISPEATAANAELKEAVTELFRVFKSTFVDAYLDAKLDGREEKKADFEATAEDIPVDTPQARQDVIDELPDDEVV